MIRVRTGSRLHFGLLSLPGAEVEQWPDRRGHHVLPARHYGGVGLMVEAPGVQVSASPASAWSAEGPLAERALTFARRFAQTLPENTLPPLKLVIEHSAAEHSGLGTGTQLALAVARTLATVVGLTDLDAVELGRRVGRGARSGLGIHGFAQGGFLVESGKHGPAEIAPLAVRVAFPEAWRLVVVLPPWARGWHGEDEQQAFRQLAGGQPLARTEALCRLVLLGMLPALAEHDLEAFGEALFDFNVRVGEMFAPVQGGTYASPRIAELVSFVRQERVRGVGQSSWGQAVFAVAGGEELAQVLATRIRGQFDLEADQVLVVRAANRGAETTASPAG
jgi:beta-RFAP synthase